FLPIFSPLNFHPDVLGSLTGAFFIHSFNNTWLYDFLVNRWGWEWLRMSAGPENGPVPSSVGKLSAFMRNQSMDFREAAKRAQANMVEVGGFEHNQMVKIFNAARKTIPQIDQQLSIFEKQGIRICFSDNFGAF